MRKLMIAVGAAILFGSPVSAQSTGFDNPTMDLENPGSCQGAQRGARNSPGGDREYGGLDDALVPFLGVLRESGSSFGQWLPDARAELCPYPPPGNAND